MSFLLFSNLYPGSCDPLLGSFVEERSRRLSARLGIPYRVLHPVPRYPWLPGKSRVARLSRVPREECWNDVTVRYAKYLHLPKGSARRHAERMRRGVRPILQRMVEEERPDFVDAQYLYPDACAVLPLAKELGLPCLATARGSDVNVLAKAPAIAEQLRETLPMAERLLAVSPALARSLEDLLSLEEGEVIVAPNGVDVDRFEPPHSARVPGRVVCVAQLLPAKGQELLIQALAKDGAEAVQELRLVGDGLDRGRLEALASRLRVADRVRFLGALPREAVAEELRTATLFVFPSHREGWPNAVLEALASGTPVLSHAVGGVPDQLEGLGDDWLLPCPSKPAVWAARISRILGEAPEALARRGALARSRGERHAWGPIVEELGKIYGPYVDADQGPRLD